MTFGFLNALMLLGLAGVALPVVAHLISKRRFEVITWGAMRFLELGQRTKRRIRLQDLVLLLLRMGLLACLAISLARPWGSGGLFEFFSSPVQYDTVLILDGSLSMDWKNGPDDRSPSDSKRFGTPHAKMVQWVHDALETLPPGETVSLIDARDRPVRLVPPTSDFRLIRDALSRIAPPAGTSQLPLAIEDALKVLTTTLNPARRILLLTDGQKLAWKFEDELSWAKIEELRRNAAVSLAVGVVDAGSGSRNHTNVSVGRIELSRDVTVSEFPVRIRALVRQSGGDRIVREKVTFRIDGQEIAGKVLEVNVLPDGETSLSFEHAFPKEGEFLVSIGAGTDQLPGDNVAHAVIGITSSIPVLLVDGDPRGDTIQGETFYLQSVLAASGTTSRWVNAQTISPHELNSAILAEQAVVFLCNVPKLTALQWEALRRYVQEGGGLVIAPGAQVNNSLFNQMDGQLALKLLPARLKEVVDAAGAAGETSVDSLSLEIPWLQRFRKENGVDLTQTRFLKWWRMEPNYTEEAATEPHGEGLPVEPSLTPESDSQVLARFSNGDPLIIRREFGDGAVLQLAIPLDADWSTLPAKNDFVPLIHEMIFALTGKAHQRNVNVGTPLSLALKPGEQSSDFVVDGPGSEGAPAELGLRQNVPFAQYRHTNIPGIYRIRKKGEAVGTGQPFVVDDDHRESDLAALSAADWKQLAASREIAQGETLAQIASASGMKPPPMEIWWLLLLAVLAILICEVALTRRMVQGGRAAPEEAAP